MARCKELLNSKKAMSSYVFAMVVMLVILMLSSAVWEYTQTVTLARETADCSTSALRYVQSDTGLINKIKVAVGRGNVAQVSLDTYKNMFIEEFQKQTGLEKVNSNTYVKMQGDKVAYTITDVELSLKELNSTSVRLSVDYNLALPLSLAGTVDTTINVDMHRDVTMTLAGSGGIGGRNRS